MNLQLSENLLVKTLIEEYLDVKKFSHAIVDITRLTGDASTRRYYRLTFEDQSSAIACLDKPTSNDFDLEFVTITKFLAENGISVPEIFISLPEKGFILEEDLGDKTMLSELASKISSLEIDELYQQAINEIVKVHKIAIKNENKPYYLDRFFDSDKLMYEVNLTIDNFVIHLCGESDKSQSIAILREEFSKICSFLSTRKRWVVTHRDYHSRNIMFKNGKLKLIDYQDLRLGLPTYDLVSLLEDAYYKIDGKLRDSLRQSYYDQLKYNYQSFDEFIEEYNLMAIQRIFKAMGSFSYIWKERKDHRYLKYISKCYERLSDLLLETNNSKILLQLNRIFYDS